MNERLVVASRTDTIRFSIAFSSYVVEISTTTNRGILLLLDEITAVLFGNNSDILEQYNQGSKLNDKKAVMPHK